MASAADGIQRSDGHAARGRMEPGSVSQAWVGNVGHHALSRRRNGRPSASSAEIDADLESNQKTHFSEISCHELQNPQ